MLILSKEDIKKCFSMKEAIEACKKALGIYTSKNAIVPLRNNISLKEYNGQILYMPASTTNEVISSGIKIVSVYPDNVLKNLPSVPATMILVDSENGIVSGILDGTYLTQLRTGAVQGAGTDILANKNAEIGALIGTGGQAYQQAIAMLSVRNLKQLKVYSRNSENVKNFVDNLKEDIKDKFNTEIIGVTSAKDCIENADIITTVTTSKTPTFDANYVKKGSHINGMGSYTEEMIEIPKEILGKSNKIVFDTKEGVLSEAGDILFALKEGIILEEDANTELGEIILNKKSGRKNFDDITIFKSVGSAVLDVVVAKLILKKAKQLKIGTEIVI